MGCLVLLPHQNPRANAWGCWNWFDRATAAGRGETAIVARAGARGAAQVPDRSQARVRRRNVRRAARSPRCSACGSPTPIAGVFVHSGIACGAASSPLAALGVLKSGADTDVARIAREARARRNAGSLPVPLLVVQGGADNVVAPVNAAQLVRQYLALNGHPAADAGADVDAPAARPLATSRRAGRAHRDDERMDGRRPRSSRGTC